MYPLKVLHQEILRTCSQPPWRSHVEFGGLELATYNYIDLWCLYPTEVNFRCSDSGAYLLLFESCSSTAATRRILSLDFWSVNYGLASKFQSWLLWVLVKNMKNAGPTDAYCTCSLIFQTCIAKYHFRLLIFQPLEKIISFLVVVVQQNDDLQGMVIWDRGPSMSQPPPEVYSISSHLENFRQIATENMKTWRSKYGSHRKGNEKK